MIRFALTCASGHGFESWFASDAAFGTLQAAGLLACPDCGSAAVTKAPMAPAVRPARATKARPDEARMPAAPPAGPAPHPLSTPSTDREHALAALRREVEANSDYVGMNFAVEARRIHDGEAPERAIHGEARPEEARRLIEDGIPVAPLPFRPRAKAN